VSLDNAFVLIEGHPNSSQELAAGPPVQDRQVYLVEGTDAVIQLALSFLTSFAHQEMPERKIEHNRCKSKKP